MQSGDRSLRWSARSARSLPAPANAATGGHAPGIRLAGREARGLHPRLQPVGARRRDRTRDSAHHRRPEGLRLRDRQRRLGKERSACSRLVAGFPEDRDVPAGRAPGWRDVSRQHEGRPSGASGVEVSAARRQRDRDDPARRDQCRYAARDPVPDAAGRSPLHALRSRHLPGHRVGGCAMVSGWVARRVCLDIARPQARGIPGCRRGDRRRARCLSGRRRDAVRVGERHGQLARSSRVQRGDLVLRARRLGPALSLRSHDRPAQEQDHERRRERRAAARVDEKSRTLWFVGNAKERGRDPYFRHFYKIGMDGKGLTLLTPENADHDIALAPSGQYFIDSVLDARSAAGHRGARSEWEEHRHARDGGHYGIARDSDGSRRCPSRSRRATARPISTA